MYSIYIVLIFSTSIKIRSLFSPFCCGIITLCIIRDSYGTKQYPLPRTLQICFFCSESTILRKL